MRAVFVAVFLSAVAGCGSDNSNNVICADGEADSPEACPGLVAGFTGLWVGDAYVESWDTPSFTVPGMIVWTDVPDSTSLPVLAVCPAGDGEIVAEGAGLRATWRGRLECAPIDVGGCEAVHTVLYRVDLSYNLNEDALTMQATGAVSGCGIGPSPMSLYVEGLP